MEHPTLDDETVKDGAPKSVACATGLVCQTVARVSGEAGSVE